MKVNYIITLLIAIVFAACNSEPKNQPKIPKVKMDSLSINKKDSLKIKNTNGIVNKRLSGLSIDIPEELNEVDKEKIKIKYPGANRPDVVYSNADMSVNFIYSVTKNPLKESDLKDYLVRTSSAISKNFGKESLSQNTMDTINGREFAVIEFYSPVQDGEIYNLMFTTSVNDKMAIFSFNCNVNQLKDWEDEIPDIFDSIKFD